MKSRRQKASVGNRMCWVHSLVEMSLGAQWNRMQQPQGREVFSQRVRGGVHNPNKELFGARHQQPSQVQVVATQIDLSYRSTDNIDLVPILCFAKL